MVAALSIQGQRFGRLMAVDRLDVRRAQKVCWLCKCDCGSWAIYPGPDLVAGASVSCGCAKRERLARYRSERRALPWRDFALDELKLSAAKRGLVMTLSDSEIKALMLSPCLYCGAAPSRRSTGIIRNGVDRMDNAVGYTPENAVACCPSCNFAKGRMSAEEFIEMAVRIAKNWGAA